VCIHATRAAPFAPAPFRFAEAVSDGMVLQSAPKQAMIWGFCNNTGDKVIVSFNGHDVAATTGPDQALSHSVAWISLTPVSGCSE